MMRVFMFQHWGAEKIRRGEKRQTIRGRARCKPGDALSLREWADKPYRSKQVLIENVICKSVEKVKIPSCVWPGPEMRAMEALAVADGFLGWDEMAEWFDKTHGLPFEGEVVRW